MKHSCKNLLANQCELYRVSWGGKKILKDFVMTKRHGLKMWSEFIDMLGGDPHIMVLFTVTVVEAPLPGSPRIL